MALGLARTLQVVSHMYTPICLQYVLGVGGKAGGRLASGTRRLLVTPGHATSSVRRVCHCQSRMLPQRLPATRPSARARLVTTAGLERNAKALSPKQLVVERQIGEGSFGQVFLVSALPVGASK